jgi:hypothetical protein
MIRMGMEFELIFPEVERFLDKKKMKEWVKFADANWEYSVYIDNDRPLPKYARKLGYRVGDDIPDPRKVLKDEKKAISEIFNKHIRRHSFVKNFPFPDYIISIKDDKKSTTLSIMKPDFSLGPVGLEISTHVMSLKKALDYCDIMFSYIDDYAVTTDDCGFHVSISDSNIRKMKKLNVRKMLSGINKRYIYAQFPDREKCQYADPTSYDHYGAVNLEHIKEDNPYVEFRHIGGKDYHKKHDTIKRIMLNYVESIQMGL